MRNILQVQYIIFALTVCLLAACSQDEVEQVKEETLPELRVMVNQPSDIPTRASINGAITTFSEGDKIGIFVIDPNTWQETINVAYEYDGTNWNLVDQSKKIYYSPNFYYFAYYPYVEKTEGEWYDLLSYETGSAESFFSSFISGWEPILDQSNLENYLASDLMVGKGVSTTSDDGSGMVSFTLEHQMGLVQISLIDASGAPIDITELNSDDIFEESMTVDLQTDYFSVPYNDGQYFRYIAKPQPVEATTGSSVSFKIREAYGEDIVYATAKKGKMSSLSININN